ncbi:MAG TPA: hypothetical protein VFM06_05150 [Candidatus Limnocylindria bacterium]|nr:hypothetical protein [Candidatus Limnocylindria bacterium]
MPDQLVLDIKATPEAVLARLQKRIGERPKRAFGVLKTQNEFVGAVADDRFEIWERNQRAVHAVGSVRARRGGTRVEVRFPLTPVSRALLVAFAILYAVVAAGIATQPPDTTMRPEEVIIAASGAALIGALFYGSARRQRRDLEAFLREVLSASA